MKIAIFRLPSSVFRLPSSIYHLRPVTSSKVRIVAVE